MESHAWPKLRSESALECQTGASLKLPNAQSESSTFLHTGHTDFQKHMISLSVPSPYDICVNSSTLNWATRGSRKIAPCWYQTMPVGPRKCWGGLVAHCAGFAIVATLASLQELGNSSQGGPKKMYGVSL